MKTAPAWFTATAYGVTVACALGTLVGILRWSRLERGQRVAVLWIGTNLVSIVASMVAAKLVRNSQITAQFWFPVSVLLAMESLGSVQGSVFRRDAMRFIAVAYAVIWLFLLGVAVEVPTTYSSLSAPLHAIALMGGAATTIVRRASTARHDLLGDQGFVLALGFLAYGVPSAFLTHVALFWMKPHPMWVLYYWGVRNVLAVLAVGLLIYALYLPSGGRRAATAP